VTTRDPITFELMQHAIATVADQMAVTVVRTARSTVSKEVLDFSTALTNAEGELIAQGLCIPLLLGSMPAAIRTILDHFGRDVRRGDVYVLNNPYEGGSHLPDVYMFKPVFVGETLLGFSCTVMHHADMGGIAAGGISPAATEIFQEGLCIPPLRLVEAGRPNETLLAILSRNVRVPEKVIGDLHSQIAACTEGEEGLIRVAQEYGLETTRWYLRDLLDYAEERTRQAIARLPDGEFAFEDHLDDDGMSPEPIPIRVRLVKRGDELTADFTGTSPQVKGAINMTRSFTLSCLYFVARTVLDPDIPSNAGLFRPLTIVTTPGTIVDALPPASVASRVLTAFRVSDALFGAFARMLPGRVLACGVAADCGFTASGLLPDRTPFVQLDWVLGSWGGRPGRDGIDHAAPLCSNFSNTPVEVIEVESPMRVEEYALVVDTAGPGLHRGGLGVTRRWRLVGADEATVHIRADRLRFPPYGLDGGRPGARGRTVLDDGATRREMSSKFKVTLRRGQAIQLQTAGAGGWGDPMARDPARVLADVRDGKVSPEHARSEYGVVVRPASLELDRAATEALRAERGPAAEKGE
jgi:N-methylhydantoinase B